ncbi:MAG: formate dehydrogenase accessory sulfurtransferase FdhD [Bacteroidetes bacterium]|nr:formate dehydrogenase accessory sulfurtransferase FdhD [Bacteroidota bacterium]
MIETAASAVRITKINDGVSAVQDDFLASEEPLQIGLVFGEKSHREQKSISVTMRTPGNDEELALGFLFTEGIISQKKDWMGFSSPVQNTIEVELHESSKPDLNKLERNFYTTSSCGVCGKSSIDAIRTVATQANEADNILISTDVLYSLPSLLRQTQHVFEQTGGLHASAIFDLSGKLLFFREDVGRHNALDKVIGWAFRNELLPLNRHILLLSGRASFELIQKAAMAGIKVIAAVGAPSTLAVELAKEFDMTLVGFLRGSHFNIYCGEKRISV